MPSSQPTNHIHPTIMQYTSNLEIASKYDEFFKNSALFRYDCEFIHENISAPAMVLDLGCGTARHMLFLESLGFETYGIDLSKHFLKTSKRKLKAFGYNDQKLIQADIMHLPLNKNARFDAVLLMFSVLGLIQGSSNRISLLSSLRANLHKKSKVLIHVHNYEFRHSTLIRKLKSLQQIITTPSLKERGDKIVPNYRQLQDLYIHSFTIDEIIKLFNDSGYTINCLVGLNARRDGPCKSNNISANANGFLISASPNY